MAKIYEVKINRFDGGISDDPREPISNVGSLIKHFDIFSNPYKLIPYRSSEADENDGVTSDGMKTYNVRHFTLGSNGTLYGLGANASGQPKVVSKATPASGNWTLPATAEGNAARILGAFIEWQSSWYFFQGTTQLARWAIGGTVTNTVLTVGTITTVAQGIVGPDNNLYMFYNNKVVRVNSAGTATDDVLTALPSDMRITSVSVWGNYLAIGMAYGTSATATPAGRSKVFLWDMVTTSTVADVLDWGEGFLRVLGNIEGRLCGVSDKYLSSSLGLARGSMVVRLWSGGAPQVMKEIVANQTVTADTSTVTRFPRDVVIKNNKMYWAASVPFLLSTSTESTFHLGIWVFGRKNANSNFALAVDYVEEAADTANFYINSFGNAGDFWFINHSSDGSIEKTDDAANYTYTSIYDTQIQNGAEAGLDSSVRKKLIGVTVLTQALPAAGQVVLRYRINEETAYTLIFTNTTDNSISRSAINIESSGATLPEYREIVFRVESTGGAEITGIKYRYEVLDKDFY